MTVYTATPRGQAAHQLFLDVQTRITDALASLDGRQSFRVDQWDRPEGGGGRSMVIEDGRVFEKGGVNVSAVYGELSEAFARELPGSGRHFFATGVSLVIHPRNPHVPTVHANFRYLEKGDGEDYTAWFGGGADLTPWILYEEDAVHFHRVWKAACDRHPVADHDRLRKWCDEYFYLPHRGETRGVGGIFFDYFGTGGERGTPADLDEVQRFVEDAAGSFLDAYLPIVERRQHTESTEAERAWQLVRRGRYVEFNLVYDRGTVFGLKTGGRIESILMSLPNLVAWKYDHQPEPGYQTALLEVLKQPRDWLA
ncbi:MAG: oxygen-dependent coproporphyrinogen oxidase [Deltaproteobacteria bacterium]|nr:oxygen-dependent coproporphyrinogen oxidase [Deltaproteobacteria bacterium]